MTERKSSLKPQDTRPLKTVTYDDSIQEVNEVLEKSDKFERMMDRIDQFENYRTPQKLPSINNRRPQFSAKPKPPSPKSIYNSQFNEFTERVAKQRGGYSDVGSIFGGSRPSFDSYVQ